MSANQAKYAKRFKNIEDLLSILKMFTDECEVCGVNGNPLTIEYNYDSRGGRLIIQEQDRQICQPTIP